MSRNRSWVRPPVGALVAALIATTVGHAQQPAAAAGPRPRLIVVLSVDQLRADYLARFGDHFGAGGFNLLLRGGASFPSARHEHAITSTCPGHAVMLTGSYGSVTGIIANEWFDRASRREVYCAADTAVRLIGVQGAGRSPRQLEGATIGDLLKISTGGRSRVITVSAKDRAAIMMGGHLADVAYWMVDTLFVSSTYYLPALPPWARAFNASGRATSYSGKRWERHLPAGAYEQVGPDDVPWEADEAGLGRTFPHPLPDRRPQGSAYADALATTPFGNDVVAEFAMRAVAEEALGRDEVPDLLGISFSANDRIGHAFGPDSHEVMDVTVRLDRTLARLFGFLDQRVGLEHVLIVLTADHGVAPLPELFRSRQPRAGARRFDERVVDSAVRRAMEARYGAAPAPARGWVAYHAHPQIYLDRAALRARRVAPEEAERVAQEAVRAIPGVHEVLTATELARARALGLRTAEALSFHPARSGDLHYQMAPYILVDGDSVGTGHGTRWAYDQQVPLLLYGSRIVPGVHRASVAVADIAPTLAALLGLTAPGGSQGRVLAEALR